MLQKNNFSVLQNAAFHRDVFPAILYNQTGKALKWVMSSIMQKIVLALLEIHFRGRLNRPLVFFQQAGHKPTSDRSCRQEKHPQLRVLRLISRFSRLMALLVPILIQCSVGKLQYSAERCEDFASDGVTVSA